MKALIVIDMQNDFVTGPLGTPEAVAAVDKIKNKLETEKYDFIYFTRDTHGKYYLETLEGIKLPVPHCIYETDGWQIVDELAQFDAKVDKIINKDTFGYCFWDAMTKLSDFGQNDCIEVVGVCTDICVVSNVLTLKAFYPDTPIQVDASCCAGTTPEMHQKALDVMKSCQIDIINEGK